MSSWDDLRPRVISAVVMLAVGVGAILAGGAVFAILVAICVGLMVWELVRMLAPDAPQLAIELGAVGAGALLGAVVMPVLLVPVIAVAVAWGIYRIERHRMYFLPYAGGILLAGYGLVLVRAEAGLEWMLWLALVVVATDVAGYFAGRLLGGPKFWPRVSPKKTWSGTAAGWVAAAIVGLAFGGVHVVIFSVILSFASQMGDIAESALKRKMGVKDSSNLIPGHGGLMDRFDGMMGAAMVLVVLALLFDVFPVAG